MVDGVDIMFIPIGSRQHDVIPIVDASVALWITELYLNSVMILANCNLDRIDDILSNAYE